LVYGPAMADKLYRAIAVTNTASNDEFSAGVEEALNKLDAEGYEPHPGYIFPNGHHVVLVGKRKRKAKKAK